MRKTTRLTILYSLVILIFCSVAWQHAHAIRPSIIYGGMVDNTQASATIPPCTAMGYSVETTLTTAIGANYQMVFHRVQRDAQTTRYGYAVIRHVVTGEYRLIVYNTSTMATVSNTQLQANSTGKYGEGVTGEIHTNTLYLFRHINTGFSGCVGGPCAALNIINESGTVLGESIVLGLQSTVFDDTRMSGATTLLLVDTAAAGLRRLSTWSTAGTKIFQGPNSAINANGLISYGVNSYNFVGFKDAAKTVWRVQGDSTTIDATGSFNASFPINNSLGAILVFPGNDIGATFVIGESIYFGGTNAVRGYLTGGLAFAGTTTTYVATDGSAGFQGTFWDATNQKVHSFRADGGAGPTEMIIRSTPDTGTIEERFTCGGGVCVVGSSAQVVDFIESYARLFAAVTSGSNAVFSRIKVCAAGGPSA